MSHSSFKAFGGVQRPESCIEEISSLTCVLVCYKLHRREKIGTKRIFFNRKPIVSIAIDELEPFLSEFVLFRSFYMR